MEIVRIDGIFPEVEKSLTVVVLTYTYYFKDCNLYMVSADQLHMWNGEHWELSEEDITSSLVLNVYKHSDATKGVNVARVEEETLEIDDWFYQANKDYTYEEHEYCEKNFSSYEVMGYAYCPNHILRVVKEKLKMSS